MDQATPGRRGRFPCEKFKAKAVAVANGINAIFHRR
jgi:hypothetical protein